MSRAKPREEYERLLKETGINKNSIIIPEGKLISTTLLKLYCSTHGWYETSVNTILKGSRCPICARSRVSRSQRKSRQDRIDKANEVHSGLYDYSLLPPLIKNNKIKVRIICPEHGVFVQRLNDHLAGKGCLACSKNSSDKSYVLLIDDCGVIVGLKYGITKNLERRHKELQAGTRFNLTSLATFQFDNCIKVADAEKEIKRNVKPILEYKRFHEGFTETCGPQMFDYIISVFKKYGGVRL